MSARDANQDRPEPAIRTMPLPGDANANGDIFGGWILSQMDLAGGIVAAERAGGRMVTVAVEGMKFHRPVFVGDTVSCYARITRIGRTSITVDIETVARRHHLRFAPPRAVRWFVGCALILRSGPKSCVSKDRSGRTAAS